LDSDYKTVVEDVFKEELEATFLNRFRNSTDIQRILFSYYAIAKKRGNLTYVNRKESYRISVHKRNYQKYIIKYNPNLFCLNDTEDTSDNSRKHIQLFFLMYPIKTEFEK